MQCSAAYQQPMITNVCNAANAPEENRLAGDSNTISENAQESLSSLPEQESNDASVNTEKKEPGISKCKSVEEIPKTVTIKRCKNIDSKKVSLNNNNNPSFTGSPALKKQPTKGGQLFQLHENGMSQDTKPPSTRICINSACKAVFNSDNAFCKRCSCCICHGFDDNKDPSLWLVCSSETGDQDCCGSSCHIECALKHRKAGCIELGQSIQLDGNYCCAACGKVIGILGFWKRQLVVAKDARRVDNLCSRIYLSHRLLDGTTRFKELHQIVEDAKAKLESEVGPLDGTSSKMARGIVGRLPVAADVQKLCSLAIEKADECLSSNIQSETKQNDTLPSACRFKFEDITASSLVLVLKEAVSSQYHTIKGYKLWYWNSREAPYTGEPAVFPKDQRRILISNLQPCTEYSFRIISFTEDGELGHSESKIFTKSVEIIHKNTEHGAEGCSSSAKRVGKRQNVRSLGFQVRQLGNVFRKAQTEENGYPNALCKDEIEDSCDQSDSLIPDKDQVPRGASRKLNLNETSVPDLNAEVVMPTECCQIENGCSSGKNAFTKSNGCGDSETCAEGHVGDAPAMESRSQSRKQASDLEQETCVDDSNLVARAARLFAPKLGQLDDNYEYCVKIIRWLECSGLIEKDFRMKFLTWFSLRSTEQERRVVITFIRTLIDEPSSLAAQLLDSFEEIVTSKRLRTGFCTKLWH
ncbi:VIN3-like protein 1 isoform X3 [Sorghum bicolor]|uniref:VIN3-like protein 1 isoform X3 n=1 Tax=Sorghum bicolor TaxID=4558 RepID=UPI000B425176|nr:VIN3-like protein 1 isoform X3 [Sorghum bicolor]|eukprot:XP_021301950.1 VIN3-like protein 1 isoform X3 [Sorghum bicolor]